LITIQKSVYIRGGVFGPGVLSRFSDISKRDRPGGVFGEEPVLKGGVAGHGQQKKEVEDMGSGQLSAAKGLLGARPNPLDNQKERKVLQRCQEGGLGELDFRRWDKKKPPVGERRARNDIFTTVKRAITVLGKGWQTLGKRRGKIPDKKWEKSGPGKGKTEKLTAFGTKNVWGGGEGGVGR